jgi:putative hydrolase of the HAD superfamily
MQEIQAIIFDFGGVFSQKDDLNEIGRILANKYQVSPTTICEITARGWMKARINPGCDPLFWRELARTLGISVSKLKQEYLRYPIFIPETAQLARRLKKRYRVGMLSNQIETWHRLLLSAWKLHRLFRPMITSYNEGLAKPDPRIYRRTLRALDLPAEACIYIDDRAENLIPAAHLGMHTILFKTPKQLKRDLRALNVSA